MSCVRCGTPLCEEHAPTESDRRCERCEREYADKTSWLQGAADGRIYAEFGRPFVVFISAFVLPGLIALGVVTGGVTGGLAALALGLLGSSAWYRRTPPRQRAARRRLKKKRRRFLAKRARRPLELPPARPSA
jgi:hypothetical protein